MKAPTVPTADAERLRLAALKRARQVERQRKGMASGVSRL